MVHHQDVHVLKETKGNFRCIYLFVIISNGLDVQMVIFQQTEETGTKALGFRNKTRHSINYQQMQ